MTTSPQAPAPPEVGTARPLRRILPTVVAVVVVGFLGGTGYLVWTSGQISWTQVGNYLTDDRITHGVVVTFVLTVVVMAISAVLGCLLAMMRSSGNLVLRGASGLYIWFFRGTPLLVQIVFWFNIALFVPRLSIGPVDLDTNEIVTPYTAAVLALSLHEAAYMAEIIRSGLMAEIIRSGLMAVPRGQREAATALGLTPAQAGRRVILPQALRIILPPTGNQTIGMLKTTSLVSVIAAQDLLTEAQHIYAQNFLVVELLVVAALWYLALTTVASGLQYLMERRLTGARRREASR